MSKAILLSIKPEWLAKILNREKTIEVRKNKALANAIRELIKQYGKALICMYCSNTVNKNLVYFFNKDINLDTTIGEWEEHYQILTNKELKNITLSEDKNNICRKLNGKVVARFWCDKVEEIYWKQDTSNPYITDSVELVTLSLTAFNLMRRSCLSEEQLINYLDEDCLSEKEFVGYAIHISKLEVFDRPKELGEFLIKDNSRKPEKFVAGSSKWKEYYVKKLTKAPQNYCYVEGD